MAAELPDFAAVAATLHPDCLIRQPAALPYGGVVALQPYHWDTAAMLSTLAGPG